MKLFQNRVLSSIKIQKYKKIRNMSVYCRFYFVIRSACADGE